jgi:hypothetical protein
MTWIIFPTGRWCATINAHGGHLALHAWPGGEWAVTRGAADVSMRDPFLAGSRQPGQPTGRDLDHAKELARAAAEAIAENERILYTGGS